MRYGIMFHKGAEKGCEMPYELLREQAYRLIDDVPKDKIGQIVSILRNVSGLLFADGAAVRPDRIALRKRLMSYVGCIPADIDEDAVVREAREAKHGRFD